MKLENDAKLSIAKKLRALREEHSLTQADLGRVIGRPYTTIASWESGKGQPDADTFLRLMAYYRVEDVVGEFGYEGASTPLSRKERALVESFRLLSDDAQSLAITLVNGLKGISLAEKENDNVALFAAARGKQPADIHSVSASALDLLPDEGWRPGKDT